jgi:hypothetical protein
MTTAAPDLRSRLRPALPGLVLAILTILFGQGIGVVFGAAEDELKNALSDRAKAVATTVYEGDATKAKEVLGKAFTYVKRAHLHAGAMGTTAVALIVLLAAAGAGAGLARGISLGLGAGGLGYSVYWLLGAFKAASMGGTGPAKEALAWLALPSAAIFCLSTLACLGAVIMLLRGGTKS